ncbi:arylsulfatase [Planctomycetota bacterium]
MRPFVLCVFCFLLSVNHEVTADDSGSRPNVVLIVADDLGYRELGCFGQDLIKTPNLDRLAKQGLRFTQHYSGNAVCAPSRCVLMTGKHPGHAWVRNNSEMKPEGQQPIPASEITIGELLQENGYVTGVFGKWGLGGPGSEGEPMQQGFDRFFGYNCQRHAHSYYPSYLWSNAERIQLDNVPPVHGHATFGEDDDSSDPRSYDQFKGRDYAPDRINDQAVAFIRANKNKPFFLYYPTIIPHVALHVPDEELKPYLDLGWEDPPFTKAKGYGYTPHFTPRAAYAAMITRMDRYIGNVLDTLDDLGMAENTIVIFSSDNGTTHLKDEVDYTFFKSVGELRGLKGSLYEGGIRVPTIVRWPGVTKPDTKCDFVSGFEDWLPTILNCVGAKEDTPPGLDGCSLVPQLKGHQAPHRDFLYREFSGYGGQQAIRVGNWKAIRTKMNAGNTKIELYDLAQDVSESQNVADDNPDVVARLERLMSEQHVASQKFPLRPFDAPAQTKRQR